MDKASNHVIASRRIIETWRNQQVRDKEMMKTKTSTILLDKLINIFSFGRKKSLRKEGFNLISLIFIASYMFKFFWIYLSDLNPTNDIEFLLSIGDTTHFIAPRRKYLKLVLILIHITIIGDHIIINYSGKGNKQNWRSIFDLFYGKISPYEFGFKEQVYIQKLFKKFNLIVAVIMVLIYSFSILTTMANFHVLYKIITRGYTANTSDLFFSILWTILNSIWGHLISSTLLSAFIHFYFNCYYLKLRLSQLNNLISSLLIITKANTKKCISSSIVISIFEDHNQICRFLFQSDKLWSKYYLLVLLSLIPASLILLFQVLFASLSPVVQMVYWSALINCWFTLYTHTYACATIPFQMKKFSKNIAKLQWKVKHIKAKMKVFNHNLMQFNFDIVLFSS